MAVNELIRAYLAGSGLPETPAGVLVRSGVGRAAAERWAAGLTLEPRAQEEEQEEGGDDGEMDAYDDVGMGTGNECLINGPILGDGFDRFIYDWLGWAYCTADRVRKRMAEIEGNVVLRINSPGGYTSEMSAIAVMIAERRKMGDRVDGVVDGVAASAAAILFLLCDDRLISEFGSIMMHRAWIAIIVVGNQNDIRNAMDGPLSGLEAFDSQQASLIARVSGQADKWVANTLDRELWYGRDKAVESGLATGGYPDERSAGEGQEGDGQEARAGDAPRAEGGGRADSGDGSAAGGTAALQRALSILELN